MKLLIIVLPFFIFGCATTAKYQRACESWLGQTSDKLVSAWGAPASTFKMDSGNKVYTYASAGPSSYSTIYNPSMNMAYTSGGPRVCKTDFTLSENGVVIAYRFEGACFSK